MIVFKNNIERNILSFIVRHRGSWNREREARAFLCFGGRIAGKGRAAGHLPRADERLYPFARQSGDKHRQRAVKPPTRHFGRDAGFETGRQRIHGLGHAAMTILISSELHQCLIDIAAVRPSEEVCGLLFGTYNHVQTIELTSNVSPTPSSNFEIDPVALIAAHRAARAGGPPILGCFHSHPNERTSPSPTDEANSAGDGSFWLIIAAGIITGWRAIPGGFEPQPILLSE
jgi:desampylase